MTTKRVSINVNENQEKYEKYKDGLTTHTFGDFTISVLNGNEPNKKQSYQVGQRMMNKAKQMSSYMSVKERLQMKLAERQLEKALGGGA